MLALTRRPREAVILRLADGTYLGKVVVIDCSRDKVRIGLDLPKEITVIREELDAAWVPRPIEPPA
jgi:carbon storage regulator CsrA